MFGDKKPTHQRVADQLGLIGTVREANTVYSNLYSVIRDEGEKIVLSSRQDKIDFFLQKVKFQDYTFFHLKIMIN